MQIKNRLIPFLALSIFLFYPSAYALKVVILGDSLTEGYGVHQDLAFPALVQKKFQDIGRKDVQIIASGVSGATTSSGVPRLKWLLKSKPQVLVLALGSNDGLRGFKISEIQKNLSETIELAQKNNMKVFLSELKMPPNYGKTYTKDFESLFKELAHKYKIPLVPFLLENVGGNSKLNQSDGIHPNEKGHAIMAENIFKYLKENL